MKNIKLFVFFTLLLNSGILLASTFTLNPGWNLLGTMVEIPVSQILTNTSIKNVVIYQNGLYKASNNNEFTVVPGKSGFFVFSDSSTTINLNADTIPVDTSVTLAKVDGNGNELANDAVFWDILHVKDANLYLEMKNDFTIGQLYLHNGTAGDATEYCNNLLVGTISGWRLPTVTELTGLQSVSNLNPNYFLVDKTLGYWTSTNDSVIYYFYGFFSGSSSPVRTGIDRNFRVACVKSVP